MARRIALGIGRADNLNPRKGPPALHLLLNDARLLIVAQPLEALRCGRWFGQRRTAGLGYEAREALGHAFAARLHAGNVGCLPGLICRGGARHKFVEVTGQAPGRRCRLSLRWRGLVRLCTLRQSRCGRRRHGRGCTRRGRTRCKRCSALGRRRHSDGLRQRARALIRRRRCNRLARRTRRGLGQRRLLRRLRGRPLGRRDVARGWALGGGRCGRCRGWCGRWRGGRGRLGSLQPAALHQWRRGGRSARKRQRRAACGKCAPQCGRRQTA